MISIHNYQHYCEVAKTTIMNWFVLGKKSIATTKGVCIKHYIK